MPAKDGESGKILVLSLVIGGVILALIGLRYRRLPANQTPMPSPSQPSISTAPPA
jgi:hypothetical protein